MRRSLCLLAALALLACSVVAAEQLQFEVSAGEQVYLNQLHAPENAAHLEQMAAVFLELDSDADGIIDAQEMEQHLAEGTLSQAEHTLMQAFDNDASGSVSQAEFMMSPHTLAMLETEATVDTQRAFRMGAINIIEEPMAAAEAAFEGRDAAPQRRLKSRADTAPATMLSELSSHATIPVDAKAAKRTAKGPSKRVAGKPLPVSIFGVPSVADEECVMCQYFVQRIQAGVADRLENGPGSASAASSSAGPQGLPGSTAAAQQTLKIRNINSQLSKKPGGRGVVRVVAEDVINGLCAVDRMPILFNPYCSGVVESNALNAVRKGIFFNIPTVEVCAQAALCRDDSYLNTNSAVHATKTSMFLNGQRGICGMLGGGMDRSNARENILINAICAAHGAVFTPKK